MLNIIRYKLTRQSIIIDKEGNITMTNERGESNKLEKTHQKDCQ